MAERTCYNCMYCCCDPCLWLRLLEAGESILPRCANHPQWPGQLHDVPGVPCRNYRPRPAAPQGDNVRMIPLTDGGYAYVDTADYEWLKQWNWRLEDGYAARMEKGKIILMHRQIVQPPEGLVVDHIDGNRANNCRVNLRVCTRLENTHNQRKRNGLSSIYKGVFYYKRRRKWYAKCVYRGEPVFLGYFDNEVEAARAYDRKAVELFGEFARLNFPREWPPERRAQVYAQRQEPERQGTKKKSKGKSKEAKGSNKKPAAKRGTHDAPRATKKAPARPGTRGRRERQRRTTGRGE